MEFSRDEAFAAVERMADTTILVVGDVILDRYVWGKVNRISPEAPVPILEVGSTDDRLGGAANVVTNLRNLGCKVILCGYIGDDEEGKVVIDLLEKQGVSEKGFWSIGVNLHV
jgi:rfaE bifunctional protein kinase chain/domain